MFEAEIRQYDKLADDYRRLVAEPMGEQEYRKHCEVLFSCHSCGIEGSTFSVDDTWALFEQQLGFTPKGRTLMECQEMADHFAAYEWLHLNLDHPFDVELAQTLNRLVTLHTLPYKVPGAEPGAFTTVDMAAGDTLFGDHESLIAQLTRLMESTTRAMDEQKQHPMVLAAKFHGFFEYLHPFRDGNGRTGRLLSNYILLHFQLPELIILKDDREAYIHALRAKRTEGTDEYLIQFFFDAACQQMADAIAQKQRGSRPMLFF